LRRAGAESPDERSSHVNDTAATAAPREAPRLELEYPWAQPPGPAQACPVAPGVYWLRMPLPFALDHINLWLLEDGEGWTIVDTGIGRDEVRELWRDLFRGAMGGRPVTRIVVTHFHPDHFGLAGWLHEVWDAPVWMTRTEWLTGCAIHADAEARFVSRQVELFRRNGLDAARLEALERRGNAYRRIVSPPPLSFHRIRDGERIDAGGRGWRVVVGEGHAPEHACLYCEEAGVLIAGDQVLPRITPNVSLPPTEPYSDPLASFLESTRRFDSLPADTLVLPSHGLPFRGLHRRVEQFRRHHEARLVDLVAACAEPRSAAELLPVLFNRELDVHQVMFAMGESLSHLVHATATGRLQRETGSDHVVRYRR